MNLIFVVSAPSGAGKSALVLELEKKPSLNIKRVVTHTTRAKRPNEENGRDYHFIDTKSFRKMIEHGEFVEYASVHGHLYGTSRKALQDVIESGHDAVLVIDVQGALRIMKNLDGVVGIFILPPSYEEWINRLTSDGVREDLNTRLKTAIFEFDKIEHFDYCLVNDRFEETLNKLECIIHASHTLLRFRGNEVKNLIEKLRKTLKEKLHGG